MKLHRFAIVTSAATFLLLLVGGLVNPTGSSLACPDWPLCHGSAFPEMRGGILFEHSHRLVATTVGLLTVVLAVLLMRKAPLRREPGDRTSERDRSLARLGLLAVLLVLLQGVLGGLTVLLKLPPEISIAHLGVSMLFFVLTVFIAVRTASGEPAPVSARLHRLVVAGGGAVWAQIVLGGVVRHTGSAMACADDIPWCFGEVWPAMTLGRIQMAHRLFGVLVALYVATVAVLAARRLGGWLRGVAVAVPALLVAQVVLGVYTVVTMRSLPVVEAHLGVGAALLAAMALLASASKPELR